MADKVEMQDIRGLDIDKTLRGFGLNDFIFKQICHIESTSGDSFRWYQETSADLSTTSPDTEANVSPLSLPGTSEPSWTRNTSYTRKYFRSSFISMEDMKTADVDVYARTLLRLTRMIAKAVDTRIWNVVTESQSPSTINYFATTAVGGDQWDAASYAGDPAKDVIHAASLISQDGYDISDLVLYVSPTDYESIVAWTYSKGAQSPQVGNSIIQNGTLSSFCGCSIRVSNNVTADYALVVKPNVAVGWKTLTPLTGRSIENPGIGTEIRVWEEGEAYLSDPNAACLITDTQT